MIETGFTFRGVHSSKYHIICDPATRQLLPERRRELIQVPGKSGYYIQDIHTYDSKAEKFKCAFVNDGEGTVSTLSREIAAWLAEPGILCFDNEPDKFYNAFFMGPLHLEKHRRHGEFELQFLYNPPFAYTSQQSLTKMVTGAQDAVTVPVKGTAPTPCRIIIRNDGDTVIENLHITYQLQ